MENDKYECYSWAKQQTGFDPTRQLKATEPPPQNKLSRVLLFAEAPGVHEQSPWVKTMLLRFILLPGGDFHDAIFCIDSKLRILSRERTFFDNNEEG